MGKTFLELKNQVKLQLGSNPDVSSEDDAWVGIWVNDAYLDLTTQDRFSFNMGEAGMMVVELPKSLRFPRLEYVEDIPTVTDQEYIDLDTLQYSCITIKSVKDKTNNVHLERVGYDEYRDYDHTDSGKPTKYSHEWGNRLYLYQTPDDIYTMIISYRRRPEVMTDIAEEPVIEDEWHEAILMLAVIKGLSWRHQYEKLPFRIQQLASFIKSHVGISDSEHFNKASNRFLYIHPRYS